ncbi:hypothetical protein [Actinomadura rupiterrae]|uniref:hypothetical protein n=1 Tax=Actinomadura rupiterrae TaxID=559627 RepID=UPI0020A57EC9|nr:hypothetical protein [Actinomadura rupiterrae]MCP2342261.1 hypothetical protein [Actinomadura rupiterrae]
MSDMQPLFPELGLLAEFDAAQPDFYVHGFEIERGRSYEDPVLGDRVVTFAQANGSGSLYGIWRRDDRADPATLPVVALGDEGGLHIVARDFREFLRLLASLPGDCEPDIDWECFGLRECDWDEPLDQSAFRAWLDETFGITPADDWEPIVDAAQAELEAEWAAWVHPLIPDAVWSPVHELNLLQRFDDRLYEGYANGFWLLDDYDERKRITNPALTADMSPFAENDTDTVFALDTAGRVLAVGKTAGVHVVSRDLREFFQLIAGLTDTELWCDEHQAGLRPCEPAPLRDKYLAWLETTLGLRPAADPSALLQSAQTAHP